MNRHTDYTPQYLATEARNIAALCRCPECPSPVKVKLDGWYIRITSDNGRERTTLHVDLACKAIGHVNSTSQVL